MQATGRSLRQTGEKCRKSDSIEPANGLVQVELVANPIQSDTCSLGNYLPNSSERLALESRLAPNCSNSNSHSRPHSTRPDRSPRAAHGEMKPQLALHADSARSVAFFPFLSMSLPFLQYQYQFCLTKSQFCSQLDRPKCRNRPWNGEGPSTVVAKKVTPCVLSLAPACRVCVERSRCRWRHPHSVRLCRKLPLLPSALWHSDCAWRSFLVSLHSCS